LETIFYLLPILIFFFVLLQIFAIFKKIFSFIFSNYSKLADQYQKNQNQEKQAADQQEKKNYNSNEYISLKERQEKGENEFWNSTESVSEVRSSSSKNRTTIRKNREDRVEREKSKEKNKAIAGRYYGQKSRESNQLLENLDNYSQLEKAVILKEILDKPKALRK